MKASIIPASCATALALMTAAAGSHWWSVRGFIAAVDDNPLAIATNDALPGPVSPPSATVPAAPASAPKVIVSKATAPQPAATPAIPDSQQEFFTSLLAEMRNIKRENSALRNQVAETNRDLINLQFRVDSHSTQFRPLRVEEEIDEPEILTDPPILDDGPGVLPPRPDIAGLPPLPGQE